MKIGVSAALAGCVLALVSATAATAKPQKPSAIKAAAKESTKPVRRLPGAVSQEPPPGVRVAPPPGQGAAPAAKPKAQKTAKASSKKKAKASAKKKAKKKPTAKKSAKSKEKVKSGRAALSTVAGVDANQLAVDELKGAESKTPVELLASYKQTLREGDLETAAIFLRLTAGDEPGREEVTEINDLLGITLDTQDTEALIDIAKARRANTVSSRIAKERGEDDTPEDAGEASSGPDHGSRIASAHAAVEVGPRRSALRALANYKRAVAENNREAAALALAAAAGGVPDETLAAAVDELLGLAPDDGDGTLAGAATTSAE